MDARDVERILRDVLAAHRVEATILRVERVDHRWRITVTDRAARILGFEAADGTAAAIRAALTVGVSENV